MKYGIKILNLHDLSSLLYRLPTEYGQNIIKENPEVQEKIENNERIKEIILCPFNEIEKSIGNEFSIEEIYLAYLIRNEKELGSIFKKLLIDFVGPINNGIYISGHLELLIRALPQEIVSKMIYQVLGESEEARNNQNSLWLIIDCKQMEKSLGEFTNASTKTTNIITRLEDILTLMNDITKSNKLKEIIKKLSNIRSNILSLTAGDRIIGIAETTSEAYNKALKMISDSKTIDGIEIIKQESLQSYDPDLFKILKKDIEKLFEMLKESMQNLSNCTKSLQEQVEAMQGDVDGNSTQASIIEEEPLDPTEEKTENSINQTTRYYLDPIEEKTENSINQTEEKTENSINQTTRYYLDPTEEKTENSINQTEEKTENSINQTEEKTENSFNQTTRYSLDLTGSVLSEIADIDSEVEKEEERRRNDRQL